jgi:hypothetical protein
MELYEKAQAEILKVEKSEFDLFNILYRTLEEYRFDTDFLTTFLEVVEAHHDGM